MAVERNSPRERFSTSASSRAGPVITSFSSRDPSPGSAARGWRAASSQRRGSRRCSAVPRTTARTHPGGGSRKRCATGARRGRGRRTADPRTRPSGAQSCPRGGLYASRMAEVPSGSGSGATTAMRRIYRRAPRDKRPAVTAVNALRRFAPVETGRLRRSIRVTSYGVLIGARYASFTNERGRSAGWVERAIARCGARRASRSRRPRRSRCTSRAQRPGDRRRGRFGLGAGGAGDGRPGGGGTAA